MIRTAFVILIGVVIGMAVKSGDVTCRLSPQTLDHLRDSFADVVQGRMPAVSSVTPSWLDTAPRGPDNCMGANCPVPLHNR